MMLRLECHGFMGCYYGFFQQLLSKPLLLSTRKRKIERGIANPEIVVRFGYIIKPVLTEHLAHAGCIGLIHFIDAGNQLYAYAVFGCQAFKQGMLGAAGTAVIINNGKSSFLI